MTDYAMEITLLSDATFGSGAGISGSVDTDIQTDSHGLPILSGRALKGRLVEEGAEILNSPGAPDSWRAAAAKLFGTQGEMASREDSVWIGEATLAPDLAARIRQDQSKNNSPSKEDILESLTAIRTQTAMSEEGVPKQESLRSTRVLIRGITLFAPLKLEGGDEDSRALLAACILALRRIGLGKNRGRGKVEIRLTERPLDVTGFQRSDGKQFKNLAEDWLKSFEEARA